MRNNGTAGIVTVLILLFVFPLSSIGQGASPDETGVRQKFRALDMAIQHFEKPASIFSDAQPSIETAVDGLSRMKRFPADLRVVNQKQLQEYDNTSRAKSQRQDSDSITSSRLIELWVDMALGVRDTKSIKAKLESLKIVNFKESLDLEIKALTENLHGVRQVTEEQFVSIVKGMEVVSSGHAISPIGTTRSRAYLEAEIYLTSEFKYVAVVSTDLSNLPKEIVGKLKQ